MPSRKGTTGPGISSQLEEEEKRSSDLSFATCHHDVSSGLNSLPVPGTLNELTPEEKSTFSSVHQQVAAATEAVMRPCVFLAVLLSTALSLSEGKKLYLLMWDLSGQLFCGSEWLA